MRTARTLRGVLVAGAITALAVTPAIAQEDQEPQDNGQVACQPANPDPGEETTCTAEGLEADSFFEWTATFANEVEETGTGTADADGVGEFTVTAPDGEEAEGDYTVTVTGTAEDGSEYQGSHEGTVGGGNSVLSGLVPSQDPSDDPSEDPSEEPGDDSSDDTAPAPGGDSGQVNPAPSGAVATGAGGAADGGSSAPLLIVGILAALALAGGIWWGQRENPSTDS